MSAHSLPIDGQVPEAAASASAHKSLLTDRVYLGMIMFLGSEAMLFGSFFSAFFYIRFTNSHWPLGGLQPADRGDRDQHRDPDQLVVHHALGADVDPAQQPRWVRGGPGLDAA